MWQKISERSENRIALVLFIFAFFLRVAYSLFAYDNNVMASFSDDNAYKHFGEQVVKQGFFVPDLNALGSYAGVVGPGIGWITGLVFLVFGADWLPLFIVNSLTGAFSCIILYFIGKDLYNRKIAILSAIYLSIYFPIIRFIPTAGKEVWMTFLFLATVLLFLKIVKEKKISLKLVFLGFIFVFLIHLDERFLFYAPVLFFGLIFSGERNIHLRYKKAGLFSLFVILLMIPWLIRNYYVYDRIVLISVRTNPFTEKILGYESKKLYDDDYSSLSYISAGRIDSVKSGLVNTFENGELIHPNQIKAMQKGRIPHPFTKGETMWASFKGFWRPFILNDGMYYHNGYRFVSWSFKHNLTVIIFFSWLLLFIPFGLWVLFKTNKIGFITIVSIIIIYTIIHVVFVPFTDERYRIPIEPYLILTAIAGMQLILNKFISIQKQDPFKHH